MPYYNANSYQIQSYRFFLIIRVFVVVNMFGFLIPGRMVIESLTTVVSEGFSAKSLFIVEE
jgi:hypothetical protein